jgi:hypothetical protein
MNRNAAAKRAAPHLRALHAPVAEVAAEEGVQRPAGDGLKHADDELVYDEPGETERLGNVSEGGEQQYTGNCGAEEGTEDVADGECAAVGAAEDGPPNHERGCYHARQ